MCIWVDVTIEASLVDKLLQPCYREEHDHTGWSLSGELGVEARCFSNFSPYEENCCWCYQKMQHCIFVDSVISEKNSAGTVHYISCYIKGYTMYLIMLLFCPKSLHANFHLSKYMYPFL